MTSQFSNMTSTSIFFDVVLFLLSSLVTGPSFMSISSLVLELWQFSFIRDWPEIRKSEIPPSEFCPISEDWYNLGIPNLARMSLIECYWMLEISRLLRENQLGGGGRGGVKIRPPHTDYGKYSLFLISKMYWYSGFKEDIYMFYHIHDTVS